MSSRSDFSSVSASASFVVAALFERQLVVHGQVVEPAAQVLDPAQLPLGVRQLTGHLLGPALVVPEVGSAASCSSFSMRARRPSRSSTRSTLVSVESSAAMSA